MTTIVLTVLYRVVVLCVPVAYLKEINSPLHRQAVRPAELL
jgi:hypothetical protein